MTSTMTLNGFQETINRIKVKPVPGKTYQERIVFGALECAGEGGEVADEAKKMLRDDPAGEVTEQRRINIASELGDTLFAVALASHELGMTLEDVAAMEIGKIERKRRELGI